MRDKKSTWDSLGLLLGAGDSLEAYCRSKIHLAVAGSRLHGIDSDHGH